MSDEPEEMDSTTYAILSVISFLTALAFLISVLS